MNYPFLLSILQFTGLAAMAAGAISTLHLLSVHFVVRDWDPAARKAFARAAAVQAAALLAFAFASGGIIALHFFQTSDVPPLTILLFHVLVMGVLAASIVFMVAIAKPWLMELGDGPLVLGLSLHRQIGLSLGFASFVAALVIQILTLVVPPADLHVGHLSLMTLLFWLVLAVPLLVLNAVVMVLHPRVQVSVPNGWEDTNTTAFAEESVPRRHIPSFVELPELRPVVEAPHIPARRAPRPALMQPREIDIGYATAF